MVLQARQRVVSIVRQRLPSGSAKTRSITPGCPIRTSSDAAARPTGWSAPVALGHGGRPIAAVSKYTFDMPHALVTLSDVEGNVEIEVWPKTGQSAYVVVPPPVARAIADRILRMADQAEAAARTTAEAPEDVEEATAPASTSNVVDLASRRRPD